MNGFGRTTAALVLASTAMSGQSQARAPISHGGEPVRVAIVDVHPDRLDCAGHGVTMIDMTPPIPEGFRAATAKAGRTSHGVLVATSFVNEVRRVAPDRPIEIYTINPFIKKGMNGQHVFSMKMLKEGLARIEGKGVRTAVVTFSVNGPDDGKRIADEFLKRDMILFAAAPNEAKDAGIYPAATPGVVAIAEGRTGAAIHLDPTYRTFVRFVIDVDYLGISGQATGSSFATPKAAAYAAVMAVARPAITREEVEIAFDRMGRSFTTLPDGVKRIGGNAMIDELRRGESIVHPPESMEVAELAMRMSLGRPAGR